ncbi:TnsA endonuclease N-terminal domain-containing protein [bacterium]|nr:TnsA endonuclease N-terminal domain-containing protein [bacterium]
MSKTAKVKSQADIDRWIKQGRGQGFGIDHIPWMKINQFGSIGRSHKVPGIKIPRAYHMQSDLEEKHFLISEYNSGVEDLCEQVALLPVEKTVEIAEQLGIRHPVYRGTKIPIVMTTDLILVAVDGATPKIFARNVKYSKDLNNPRTIEKLRIERMFWLLNGDEFAIVTEHEISDTLYQNIRWIRSGAILPRHLNDPAIVTKFLRKLIQTNNSDKTLRSILLEVSSSAGLNMNDATWLFKHLHWKQIVTTDLLQPLKMLRKPSGLKLRLHGGSV